MLEKKNILGVRGTGLQSRGSVYGQVHACVKLNLIAE